MGWHEADKARGDVAKLDVAADKARRDVAKLDVAADEARGDIAKLAATLRRQAGVGEPRPGNEIVTEIATGTGIGSTPVPVVTVRTPPSPHLLVPNLTTAGTSSWDACG